MTIRELLPEDYEALFELYDGLLRLMPEQHAVGYEQFRRDLTRPHYSGPRDALDPRADRALVAVEQGRAVALVLVGFIAREPRGAWEHEAPGRGVLRLVLAGPRDEDTARALIREALAGLRRFRPKGYAACLYRFGPRFHHKACARLPSAWPWVGHWLRLEGFEPVNAEVEMQAPLDTPPDRLPFPEGARLEEQPPEAEHAHVQPDLLYRNRLVIGGQLAAECFNHFTGLYVDGAGREVFHTDWLGVEETVRARGLGRAMLRDALATACERGARTASLTTEATNFRAQGLYRSERYRIVDVMWAFERPRGR